MSRPLTGLQKSQRLAALRGEKLEEARAKIIPLNPEFPYAVESFDQGYFRIPSDPTPRKQ